ENLARDGRRSGSDGASRRRGAPGADAESLVSPSGSAIGLPPTGWRSGAVDLRSERRRKSLRGAPGCRYRVIVRIVRIVRIVQYVRIVRTPNDPNAPNAPNAFISPGRSR